VLPGHWSCSYLEKKLLQNPAAITNGAVTLFFLKKTIVFFPTQKRLAKQAHIN